MWSRPFAYGTRNRQRRGVGIAFMVHTLGTVHNRTFRTCVLFRTRVRVLVYCLIGAQITESRRCSRWRGHVKRRPDSKTRALAPQTMNNNPCFEQRSVHAFRACVKGL